MKRLGGRFPKVLSSKVQKRTKPLHNIYPQVKWKKYLKLRQENMKMEKDIIELNKELKNLKKDYISKIMAFLSISNR